ncbi:hypothetical protein TNCV_4951151 [Trichonephila clavipes]|nr:hypothetical protein TNCV_4951151 [Trichonephila clavipes]
MFMANLPLKHEKHPKYLGFTLDPEFTSNSHAEALELKRVNFHTELLSRVTKINDAPRRLQHLALEILNCISEVDPLACGCQMKKGIREALASSTSLTYLELYSSRKDIDKGTARSPVYTWCRADSPRGPLTLNCNRCTQTAVFGFLSRRLRSLSFQGGH